VPFGAGGGNDIITRIVSQELSTMWKVPVIVENRPGADSLIGSEFVARAAPDGYTLLSNAVSSVAAAQAIRTDNQFNWETDLVTIGFLGFGPPFIVATSSKNKITTLDQLKHLGQAKGLTFGSAGVGGPLYLYGEELARAMGVKGVHIPYKAVPQAVLDVINGNVDYVVFPQSSTYPHVVSGALTALAIVSDRPSHALPNVPTIRAMGYQNFPQLSVTYNLIGPRGIPADIQKKIGEDTALAVKTVRHQLLDRKLIEDQKVPLLSELNSMSIQDGKIWYGLSKKYYEK
jgi:tripartite-type tricarboxylate transporter receptor subunit TctC